MSQRSMIEKLSSAFKHFFPEWAGSLPRISRFARQLKKQYQGLTKPPMVWDVLVLVMIKLIHMGFPTTALGVYLQFDCFLRPGELCGIITQHIAFPGGSLLGSQTKKVLILLPRTKTGPLQSVGIGATLVKKLMARVVKETSKDTKLFPSYTVYRQRFEKALSELELQHIGYTPHSIRHGAATMALINKGEKALPEIMYRGRWESATGKNYLQMGAAALLFAELPERILSQAKQMGGLLEDYFSNATVLPTI